MVQQLGRPEYVHSVWVRMPVCDPWLLSSQTSPQEQYETWEPGTEAARSLGWTQVCLCELAVTGLPGDTTGSGHQLRDPFACVFLCMRQPEIKSSWRLLLDWLSKASYWRDLYCRYVCIYVYIFPTNRVSSGKRNRMRQLVLFVLAWLIVGGFLCWSVWTAMRIQHMYIVCMVVYAQTKDFFLLSHISIFSKFLTLNISHCS